MFVWGWAPIFGRGISIGALSLVWYRILISVAMLGIYVYYHKHSIKISYKKLLKLSGVGTIICIHWLCFYGAIKVSNVSVTMAAFSTATLFTSIIEPLFFRRKIILYEISIGAIIIAAICLIFSVEIKYGLGMFLGIMAAFTASIFTVLNGLLVKDETEPIEAPAFSFIELGTSLIVLTLFMLCNGNFTESFFSVSCKSHKTDQLLYHSHNKIRYI